MDLSAVDLQDRHTRQRQHQQTDHGGKTPLPLTRVGEGRGGGTERLRHVDDANDGAHGNSRHHGPADQLHPPEGALLPVVEVPGGREEDDAVAGDDGDGADVRQADVAGPGALDLPGAGGREGGVL